MRPVNPMIKQIASALCLELSGCDPDAMVTNLAPYQVRGGLYVLPAEEWVTPAWAFYVPAAIAALKVLEIPTDAMVEECNPWMDSSSSNMEWWKRMCQAARRPPAVPA